MIVPPRQRGSYPFFSFNPGRSWETFDGVTPPTPRSHSSSSSSPSSRSPGHHHSARRPGKSRVTTYSLHLHPPGETVPLGLMGLDVDDDSEQDSFLVVDKTDIRIDKQADQDHCS